MGIALIVSGVPTDPARCESLRSDRGDVPATTLKFRGDSDKVTLFVYHQGDGDRIQFLLDLKEMAGKALDEAIADDLKEEES